MNTGSMKHLKEKRKNAKELCTFSKHVDKVSTFGRACKMPFHIKKMNDNCQRYSMNLSSLHTRTEVTSQERTDRANHLGFVVPLMSRESANKNLDSTLRSTKQ